MFDYTGQIVRATAGRDKEGIFCVVGLEEDTGRLLLADGKRRKAAAPKRKKAGHVDMVCRGDFRHPVIRKLEDGLAVSDSELRRALGAFRHQGGN